MIVEVFMFYLYTITSATDNKIYVGQTINPNRRWKDHQWLARNKQEQYVHRAMNKHGIEIFTFKIIATCRTQEDADETERLLIRQYDSRNTECGYNIAPGGEHAWNLGLPKEQQPMYGKKQSEYQKKRMSEIHTGKTVVHSQEWNKNISQAMKGREITWADKISKAHMGKTFTQESKDKMSNAKLGNTNKRGKTKLTAQQEMAIVSLCGSGLSQNKVSKLYHCSRSTVANILKRH